MSADRAPVAVFGFNRPHHLKQTLQALSLNEGSHEAVVSIFVDGPRTFSETEICQEVVAVASHSYGFGKQNVLVSNTNKGLRRSIIEGVSSILAMSKKVVVLEDDLVPSTGFLRYMNEALTKYEYEPRVGSVHAFQYPLRNIGSAPVFFRGADCWGWGTWADRWKFLQQDPKALLDQLRSQNLINEFDLQGRMKFSELLEKQIEGTIDSWAILWHASLFLENKLTLYPPRSLIKNIGQDGSGTHAGQDQHLETNIDDSMHSEFPIKIEESLEFANQLGNFYRKIHKPPLLYRLRLFLSGLLK